MNSRLHGLTNEEGCFYISHPETKEEEDLAYKSDHSFSAALFHIAMTANPYTKQILISHGGLANKIKVKRSKAIRIISKLLDNRVIDPVEIIPGKGTIYRLNENFFMWDAIYKIYPTMERKKEIKLQPATKPKSLIRSAKEIERKKLTNSMRYKVMRRDGFYCILCGATGKDSFLVVDHITPIAKGGKTIESNLRTLCSQCNSGKGTKLDGEE